MALLVPLLLPVITEVAAGLTVGVSNAVRGQSSGFTLQIGNKVFTNTKPFPFNSLPFELRQQIMLEALEDSKHRIVAPTVESLSIHHPFRQPGHPFTDPTNRLYDHPGNPFHPDHVNAAGEKARNGYPHSAWQWVTVNREWWAVLRARLWSRVILRGVHAYTGFLRLLEDPDSCFIRDFVHTLVLGEGAEDSFQMYTVIRSVPAVNTIVYKPWPPERKQEPFGVHAIPTNPGPSALVVKDVAFDRITSDSTRQHLRNLPRLHSLELRLDTLSGELGHLFATIPTLRRLALHLPSLHSAQLAPLATPALAHILGEEAGAAADLVEALPADGRARLESLEIHAKLIHDDQLPDLRAFLAADPRLGMVTTIIRGSEKEPVYAPVEQAALAAELMEAADAADNARPKKDSQAWSSSRDDQFVRGHLLHMEGTEGKEHWQRTTNLKLLNGFFTLRMESRK